MPQATLTAKQQRYLSLIQLAETEGKSLKAIAKENGTDASLIYAARKTLQQKGALPAKSATRKFAKVPLVSAGEGIELKTQLANGQPLWLKVPASQLADVLAVLSA